MNGPRPLVLLSALMLNALPAAAQSRVEAGLFDPQKVVDGIEISRSECAPLEQQDTGVWLDIPGFRGCMRYYAAGLASGANSIAVAWMNGDVLGPKGNDATKRQSGFGPSLLLDQEKGLSDRYGVPFIFIGRPGTYGSAGRHYTMRGRPVEADIVAATLDALKARYRIADWALGGHSGGGTLVAEMLARRTDIRCAVISSGASSYRAYLEARGLAKPGETLSRFDPSTSLDKVPASSTRRIFVIGDPRETNVPFKTQASYREGLAERGHAAWLIPLERANDARHHDLVDFAEVAVGMCAKGEDAAVIETTLRAIPDPAPRKTN
ncbi:alpha/beta hydrolase family protein [Terrihabitans sp. B22-R8]|uniref:alpha/beta hydrolase family protein n=1 Tax=Terrihabitans sp. B22-R8 TaxID=3425128 RepID=UPI00403CC1EF